MSGALGSTASYAILSVSQKNAVSGQLCLKQGSPFRLRYKYTKHFIMQRFDVFRKYPERPEGGTNFLYTKFAALHLYSMSLSHPLIPNNTYISKVKFGIVIIHERKNIHLVVERVVHNREIEQFEVTARNTSFRLQTNRLLLRNKGFKYKRPEWKIVAGGVRISSIREKIIAAIEAKIYELEK